MANINLTPWKNKTDDSTLSAGDWNSLMGTLEASINALPAEAAPDSPAPSAQVSDFYVNGIKRDPVNGVVALTADTVAIPTDGSHTRVSYTLRGTLYGRVEIGTTTDTAAENVTIVLDGCTIINDSDHNYALAYLPEGKGMNVTLARNKNNLLLCSHVAPRTDGQNGALHSGNALNLQGCGYLSVINRGGHGVKASELRCTGRPHVYCESVHDGFHGNNLIMVDGGYYYVNGANDAFGTRAATGDKPAGHISVLGGAFRCYNISQNAFDSKSAGHWYGNKLDLLTDAATPTVGMTHITTDDYGAGIVIDGGLPVDAVDGVYTCTSTTVTVRGYVEGQIRLTTVSTDVSLNGAYIKASGAHGIFYDIDSSVSKQKKVQVSAESDTVNIIEVSGADADAIASCNNATIEVKAGAALIIHSEQGNGISGSEVSLHDSRGTLLITDCGRYGITGTDIYVADSADHKTYDLEAVAGSVIVRGNALADIHARLSSKGAKGNITVNDNHLPGILLADTISAATGSTSTTGITLNNASGVFFQSVDADTLHSIPMPTTEPYRCLPYGSLPI